jgi:hypothetical protein
MTIFIYMPLLKMEHGKGKCRMDNRSEAELGEANELISTKHLASSTSSNTQHPTSKIFVI